jgi:hypothetical protein
MVQRFAISVWRPVMVGKTITVRLLYSLINALGNIILLVMLLVSKTNLMTQHGSS